MTSTSSTIQQSAQAGRIIANDREIEYAKDINSMPSEMSHIVKIEKYDRKKMHKLNRDEIVSLSNEFNAYQGAYPDSDVLALFQLNKGMTKTDEHIEVMQKSQLSSNLRTFVFQEKSSRNDEGVFLDQLEDIFPRLNGKTPYVLFELEGNKRVRQKITLALQAGIRKFIFRGGKWNNRRMWVQIIAIVQATGGEVFVSLPKRMQNKISYIKTALQFGADYVFHEVLRGWKISEDILHLNDRFEYVALGLSQALDGYPIDFRDNLPQSSHYGFSRVRTLNVANSFAHTIERIPIS